MPLSHNRATLPLLTLLHCSVDGVCGAVLTVYAQGELSYDAIVFHFMLYNAIAFGGQWLGGLVLDKWHRWISTTLAAATIMLGLAMISALGILVQTMLLGLGNCLFHVAGGCLILRKYRQTFRELGIFVSSGAIGLALGLNAFVPAFAFWILNLAGTTWLLFACWPALRQQLTEPSSLPMPAPAHRGATSPFALLLVAFLLLLCVVLRGFGGGAPPNAPVLLFPLVFALGKTLGGIVCDWRGYRQTALVVFLLGCLALQMPDNMYGQLLLALAFNMTMPLTLRLLHWSNMARPAFMFGLAAGCLLPGAFFVSLFYLPPGAMLVIQFLCLLLAWHLLPIPDQATVPCPDRLRIS